MVWMILRCLHTGIKFRKYYAGKSQLICSTHHLRMWRYQHFYQFCLNPFRTDVLQILCQFTGSLCGLLFNRKTKLRRKTHSPENSQGIFFKPLCCHTYAADHTVCQVFYAPKQINHSTAVIICHGIDGKISSSQILSQFSGKIHLFRVAVVTVFSVNPVSSHFESFPVHHDRNGSMFNTGIDGPVKQFFDLLRQCRCGNVPVCRLSSKHTVPHTSPYCISFIAGIFQCLYNPAYLFR